MISIPVIAQHRTITADQLNISHDNFPNPTLHPTLPADQVNISK